MLTSYIILYVKQSFQLRYRDLEARVAKIGSSGDGGPITPTHEEVFIQYLQILFIFFRFDAH